MLCIKALGVDSLAQVHLGSADVPIQERCKRVCLLSLIPPHQEDLADCPACTQLTADGAYNDFSGLLIVIEVHITRQSYLIGDMSNKQSHNQAWWRWTIDNFREHGFEVSARCLLFLRPELSQAWHPDAVLPDSYRTAHANTKLARACLTLIDLSFRPKEASVVFSLSWTVVTAVRVMGRRCNSSN